MKILIIENEIYLAQSIAAKLSDLGHTCDLASTTKDALRNEPYDVVLLSTNISGQDFYPVIDAYKTAVVILMISYVSNDTVSKPLKAGAKDYILKPFMIEELIRKIDHFQDYEQLKRQNSTFKRYIEHSFQSVNVECDFQKADLPIFVFSNYQKYADAFAFKLLSRCNAPLHFISLATMRSMDEIANLNPERLTYVTDFQTLKKQDKKPFLDLIEGKSVIVSSTDILEEVPYKTVEMKSDNKVIEQGDILPIEDYVKYIVLNYQHKFPDTELSKKLGISRKSLWEKRKKYGIIKKK
ncbi:MAG: response regulator [Campylobacterales bacterium]|nr:response regulator [Campylobacterales bacterium]